MFLLFSISVSDSFVKLVQCIRPQVSLDLFADVPDTVFRFEKRPDRSIITSDTKDVVFNIVLDYVTVPSLVLKQLFTFPLEEVFAPRAYSLALLNLLSRC